MKLTLGENIRNLRREKNITQEDFATIFGVSYQSVSRWENGACYPDMELLPDIADYFGITVDKLIGADKNAEQKEVNRYLDRFQEAVSKGEVYKCIDIAREGIKEYPNNYALLNKLMYALFISTDDDGNVSEWKENMQKFDSEITELGERIMKYCPDQDIRLEAMARLAFNHCEMGRKEIGRAIYESLPSMTHCREVAVNEALNEKERVENAYDLIYKAYGHLCCGIGILLSSKDFTDLEKEKLYQKSFALDKLICEDERISLYFPWGDAKGYCGFARVYARLNNTEMAIKQLKVGVKHAKAFDNRPKETTIKSLLIGEKTLKKSDFDTDDTRNACEIMRDKWLVNPDFDSIRNTSEFQEIIKSLS